MTTLGRFDLQIDRIKRELRQPRQTFTSRPNPRNVLVLPVEPAVLDPGASYHGTAYGYKAKRCRCESCTRANADIGRHFRRERAERQGRMRAEVTAHVV